jgi:MarR family transcriptional regulator for hemolysin
MRPGIPVRLRLSQAAKVVGRAFNDSLAEAGGSIPTWLVLTNLNAGDWRSQHDLAVAVGIEGPTLTRHLDALERAGIVQRRRDPDNRRAVLVELTEAGHALHGRLLEIVIEFNKRLHRDVSETDVKHLFAVLETLERNATSRQLD